ncbi:MAG TPA: trigger factor [Thermoleophilia bacterium]|nr:trigger factor [Thermoleophilia bacterium]
MKVSTERIPESQVVLEIEVEPERLAKSLDAAYRRIVQRTNVPGFRRGKAPRAMLEREIGQDSLLQEALDRLIPEVYREAIEQEDIDAIDLPQVEMVSTDPLVMKATIPVRPTVELGEYHGMWLPRDPVVVPEERVDEALEQLRHRYANLEPVKRAVDWGDVVTADVRGAVDGRALFDRADVEFQVRKDRPVFLPGLAEEIVGLGKGSEKEVDLPLPGDFPDSEIAGKACRCRVAVHEVKEEQLPALDDAFARQVGEGFADLDALRQRLTEDLRKAEEDAELDRYQDQVLATLEESAQIEYPPVLVEKEIDHLLREQVGPGGERGMEQYLQRIGKSEEELRAQLQLVAERRVRHSLLLSKVAEVEDIIVEDNEVTEEAERMISAAGAQADEFRRVFGGSSGRDAIRRSLLTRKTWDKLVEIVSSEKSGQAAEANIQAKEVEYE